MSEEILQIAEKIKEVKGKGDREKYTQLNAKFQRLARKDENAFLNEQCKQDRKTIGWERLEISSKKKKKMEISREHFMQGWA